MAETGRSSVKVKNPNADPRQKHSPHSSHSPSLDPGDGEVGNVGNVGKEIPVNDVVSSNAEKARPGWSGRYERGRLIPGSYSPPSKAFPR